MYMYNPLSDADEADRSSIHVQAPVASDDAMPAT